jgi:hypothetical protein
MNHIFKNCDWYSDTMKTSGLIHPEKLEKASLKKWSSHLEQKVCYFI